MPRHDGPYSPTPSPLWIADQVRNDVCGVLAVCAGMTVGFAKVSLDGRGPKPVPVPDTGARVTNKPTPTAYPLSLDGRGLG